MRKSKAKETEKILVDIWEIDNISEEIENALKCLEMDMLDNTQIELLLNYINKLQKENQELSIEKLDQICKGVEEEVLQELREEVNALRKENQELEKIIDLMATELSRRPLMIYLDNERDDRLVILDNPKEIIKYYTKKAEE